MKKSNKKDGELTVAPPFSDSPEFTDLDGLRTRFSIKRSLAYKLLNEGLIRGVSLRRRGKTRGKRLFDVASVRAFVNAKGSRR